MLEFRVGRPRGNQPELEIHISSQRRDEIYRELVEALNDRHDLPVRLLQVLKDEEDRDMVWLLINCLKAAGPISGAAVQQPFTEIDYNPFVVVRLMKVGASAEAAGP